MTTVYRFKAGYTKGGIAAAPSPAPTITVVDSANNIVVAALTAVTALGNLVGAYLYSYTGTDSLDLMALFHTTDATMDAQDLFSTPVTSTPAVSAGSISWPITITVAGLPVDGVDVWISTDIGGSNVVASGFTNASGVVTFLLDAGTYYAWKTLAGYNFTNPQVFTVA